MITQTVVTVSDQFVDDYLLVADNDERLYREIQEMAQDSADISEFMSKLRFEWDILVDMIAFDSEKKYPDFVGLLIRQVMGGYGDSTWFAIAKHFWTEKEESND